MRLVETDRWRLPLRLSSWIASPYAFLLLILAAGFGFYAPTLGFWFFFDDFWFLRASQSVPFGSYALDAFNYRQDGPVPELLYRPLYVVSFRGLYEAFGLHAWAYHLFSVSLHLASGLLLWQIAVKITRRPAVAHIAVLLFLLHPTYAVAVAFVTNGIDVMCTFAYLGSLWCFLCYLDGGARRRVYYGASLVAFVAAILLHPEAAYLPGLLVLSYLLFKADSLQRLRSPAAWSPFVLFALVEAGFVAAQILAREASSLLPTFEVGPHMAGNYARFTALALNPYRASASENPFRNDLAFPLGWPTLLPLLSGVAAAGILLFFERRRPGAGTFALLWLILALLPLSMWIYGASPRKLYTAGPALALAVAIFTVSCWDRVSVRLWARVRLVAPVVAALLIVPLLGVRVLEMTRAFDERTQTYHDLIVQLRTGQPAVPEGARLYLVGVPWTLTLLGSDSAGFVSAVQLYYQGTEVIPLVSDKQLAAVADPPRANDVVFHYQCPPVCQPPLN